MLKFSKIKLNKIAQDYGLADVYVFGSQLTGFKRKGSDFDIGVRFKKGLPKEEIRGRIYGNLFSDLSLCFVGKPIDLVFIDEVPLHFQFKIVAEGELIYSNDMDNSLNFLERTVNYYRDYKYFIDEFFQGILEQVKS